MTITQEDIKKILAFNRTILELKLRIGSDGNYMYILLIEPYWN